MIWRAQASINELLIELGYVADGLWLWPTCVMQLCNRLGVKIRLGSAIFGPTASPSFKGSAAQLLLYYWSRENLEIESDVVVERS